MQSRQLRPLPPTPKNPSNNSKTTQNKTKTFQKIPHSDYGQPDNPDFLFQYVPPDVFKTHIATRYLDRRAGENFRLSCRLFRFFLPAKDLHLKDFTDLHQRFPKSCISIDVLDTGRILPDVTNKLLSERALVLKQKHENVNGTMKSRFSVTLYGKNLADYVATNDETAVMIVLEFLIRVPGSLLGQGFTTLPIPADQIDENDATEIFNAALFANDNIKSMLLKYFCSLSSQQQKCRTAFNQAIEELFSTHFTSKDKHKANGRRNLSSAYDHSPFLFGLLIQEHCNKHPKNKDKLIGYLKEIDNVSIRKIADLLQQKSISPSSSPAKLGRLCV